MAPFPGLHFLSELPHGNPERYSLSAISQLLAELNSPQDQIRTVHIAGSNGKGSTGAYLGAMLLHAGLRVGHYTSPHLCEVNERVLVNGLPIGIEILDQALQEVEVRVRSRPIELSFFEAITAASFLIFLQERVDIALIEVGLGGRLDATNCIRRPELCLITGISLEHTQVLGNSLLEIAREKAGIFKSGSKAIVGRVSNDVRMVFQEIAQEKQIPCEFFGTDFHLKGTKLISAVGPPIELPINRLPVPGEHQCFNLALAATAALNLGVSTDAVAAGALRTRWPGRLESVKQPILDGQAEIWFDAAHNPEGVEALTAFLERLVKDRGQKPTILILLFGVLASKDWRGMLRTLTTSLVKIGNTHHLRTQLIFTAPAAEQSQQGVGQVFVPPHELVDFAGMGFAIPDQKMALARALELLGPDGMLVVSGSIYLMGPVRSQLVTAPFRTFE